MKGRKPVPTNLHLLHGNPGKRPQNPAAIKATSKPPRLPRFLSSDVNTVARNEWRRVIRHMKPSGILSPLDSTALSAYCLCYQQWLDADDKVRAMGVIVKQPNNNRPVQNPYLSISRAAMDRMLKILPEFGMTPSSRSRIKFDQAGVIDDEMDGIFGPLPK